MGDLKFYIAKHFWKNNENATWIKHPSFDESIFNWLKEHYIFLQDKRPLSRSFDNKTIILFYNDKKDIYGRTVVEILCFLINQKLEQNEINQIRPKLTFNENLEITFKNNSYKNKKFIFFFIFAFIIIIFLFNLFNQKNNVIKNNKNKDLYFKQNIKKSYKIDIKKYSDLCKQFRKDDNRAFIRYFYLICNGLELPKYEKWDENLLHKQLKDDLDFIEWKNSLSKKLKFQLNNFLKEIGEKNER